jgi:hypothetical protein
VRTKISEKQATPLPAKRIPLSGSSFRYYLPPLLNVNNAPYPEEDTRRPDEGPRCHLELQSYAGGGGQSSTPLLVCSPHRELLSLLPLRARIPQRVEQRSLVMLVGAE